MKSKEDIYLQDRAVDNNRNRMGDSAVPMLPVANPTSARNTNSDALRGIAILMVLGRHAGMAITILHASTAYTFYWQRIGWAGIDLFFVLSGFLISGLLFSDYQARGTIGLGRFYLRRGLKIWPSFYALIGAGLLVEAIMPGHQIALKGLASELSFMQDYFPSIWGITWSLGVEEHFYLTLPLLLLFLIRRNPAKPFASLPLIFAAIAIFSLACRFAAGWSQDKNVDPWTCLFPTHLRMDGLMFGVLICYYKKFEPKVFQRIVSWRGSWALVAAALVLLSFVPQESRHMHTWGFTVLYLAAGILVAKGVVHEGFRSLRILTRALARLGVYSYSIYVWHMFFVWKILPHFHIQTPIWNYWLSISGPIVFGITMALIIEIPVLRLRDRLFPNLTGRVVPTELRESPRDSVVAG